MFERKKQPFPAEKLSFFLFAVFMAKTNQIHADSEFSSSNERRFGL